MAKTTRRRRRKKPIMIDQPMILIPADEYQALLEEAGYLPTPKLDGEIAEARKRFLKGEVVSWESIKDAYR